MFGSEVAPATMIPTVSPTLSYLLGGGWPKGRLIEIFGKEHAGKTTLTIMALKDCYDQEEGRRAVAVVDVEHRFDRTWCEFLGLKVDDEVVISQPENAEDATDILVKLIKSGEFAAIAWDSVGASMGKAGHLDYEEKPIAMAYAAGVMTRNVLQAAPVADIHGCTVFYLNQIRADMAGRHPGAFKTPGGHALKHMTSVRLYLRPGTDKFTDKVPGYEKAVEVGFRMYFKTIKNSLAPPFREGSSDFYFAPNQYCNHIGFDVDADVAALGIGLGVIQQKNSWYEWDGLKAQGREPFFRAVAKEGRTEDTQEGGRVLRAGAPRAGGDRARR